MDEDRQRLLLWARDNPSEYFRVTELAGRVQADVAAVKAMPEEEREAMLAPWCDPDALHQFLVAQEAALQAEVEAFCLFVSQAEGYWCAPDSGGLTRELVLESHARWHARRTEICLKVGSARDDVSSPRLRMYVAARRAEDRARELAYLRQLLQERKLRSADMGSESSRSVETHRSSTSTPIP
jgi:hypothetical protein